MQERCAGGGDEGTDGPLINYHQVLGALAATSIVLSVAVAMINDVGEILLIRARARRLCIARRRPGAWADH